MPPRDGTTLLHADLRADNILLTPSRVFFIDWPWATRGAAWVDLLFMLPSVAMQGGPKPWEIFDAHPLGRSAPAAGVTAVVAAAAGFMIRGSRLPPPPGLPTVRAFQRDQGIRHWSGSSAAPAGPNPKGRRRSEDKAGGNAGSRPRRHRSLNPALQPTPPVRPTLRRVAHWARRRTRHRPGARRRAPMPPWSRSPATAAR